MYVASLLGNDRSICNSGLPSSLGVCMLTNASSQQQWQGILDCPLPTERPFSPAPRLVSRPSWPARNGAEGCVEL